jgi:SAM-dependent methyltransferase
VQIQDENYTPGHAASAVQFMKRRRVETHAAFFTPHLRPGMHLLDCGCGPGSITIGLARLIQPAKVVAVDRNDAQFANAKTVAEVEGLSIEWKAGSVYQLDFSDATFDAVFCHALLEHLSDPVLALREICRVLKPGGFAGLRSPDWDGFLVYPDPVEVREALWYYRRLQEANGGDTHAGRKLAAHCRAADFEKVQASAAYEVYSETSLIAEYLVWQLEQGPTADEQSRQHGQNLRTWSKHPDAFFAQAWGEVIAWKSSVASR